MNTKTVSKVLLRKHNDFMDSISDSNIKEIFNKHSIITGGSIVSLLLNEKVNDYDYYLTDKCSCKKIAEYFVNQFKSYHPEGMGYTPGAQKIIIPYVKDINERIRIVIPSIGMASDAQDYNSPYEYFESRPLEEGEEYVEGITAQLQDTIEDADNLPAESLEKIENNKKEPYRVIFMTSNAITLSNNIQIVIRFYGNPEEIHKNYDYVHCTNYWLANDCKLYLNQPALESILSKTLYYIGSLYPICSMIRVRKFIKKGWHINAGQFLKIAFQISELNLQDINVLDDQLVGVDNAYFFQIIEYLKERQIKEPDLKINSAYLTSIIDKIF